MTTPQQDMRILVVDDERDIQPLFLQRFRKEIRQGEVALDFAFSGEEAIEHLESEDLGAVLILSDINMPGMSGLELLENIRQKHQSPPPVVMMITAYADQEKYDRAMELGADDFITKPVDFNLLKDKINSYTNG
jgi:two-component system chemotaxis response regulator CheY